MKKVLIGVLVTVLTVGAAAYLFREPLLQAIADRLTADMFVAADTDAFDPGPALGAPLPALTARHGNRTVHDLAPFMGENGVVLFAVRSVDW
ncbi:MAG TPA: hypothetical protein VF210_06325 [Pseudomonadales bacterium]